MDGTTPTRSQKTVLIGNARRPVKPLDPKQAIENGVQIVIEMSLHSRHPLRFRESAWQTHKRRLAGARCCLRRNETGLQRNQELLLHELQRTTRAVETLIQQRDATVSHRSSQRVLNRMVQQQTLLSLPDSRRVSGSNFWQPLA